MRLKIISVGLYSLVGTCDSVVGHVFEGTDIEPVSGNYHILGNELNKYGKIWRDDFEYAFWPQEIEVVEE